MAVTSVTEIQNSALIKLGAERIISEDDDSNRARLVKSAYPRLRDKLLRSHPWKFATGRAELTIVSPTPTDLWDFTYAFTLPADNMRVLETDLGYQERWSIEGQRLMCDVSEVWIKYIKRITDVTYFDDNFCEVLAWELAADVAYALTQSVAREQSAKDSLEKALMEARSFNAQQGSVQRIIADDVLDSRY